MPEETVIVQATLTSLGYCCGYLGEDSCPESPRRLPPYSEQQTLGTNKMFVSLQSVSNKKNLKKRRDFCFLSFLNKMCWSYQLSTEFKNVSDMLMDEIYYTKC